MGSDVTGLQAGLVGEADFYTKRAILYVMLRLGAALSEAASQAILRAFVESSA
jgi:hypothetical protein